MKQHHFLIIVLPAQGHLNPSLQLTKNLTRAGARVTFATTIYAKTQLKNLPTFGGLSYLFFSDGRDEEKSRENKDTDIPTHMESLRTIIAQEVTRLVQTLADEGRPVTMVIYGMLLPWVGVVARELNIPSALLAVQSATAFAIYQKYFHCHAGEIINDFPEIDPSFSIKIPNLPVFSSGDFPSTLLHTSQYFFFADIIKQHIKNLEDDPKPCVLINTFDDLEQESIKTIENMDVISVGPLIPSAFADGKDPADKSFGCDLFEVMNRSDYYLQWLDSKPARSVIYVSFGSLAAINKEQKVEILGSLVESGKPFLWIIRPSGDEDEAVKAAIEVGACGEGIIMPWCSQVEVLSHESIGCFISHCGWNSTLESLAAGVPILGCPLFADQMTNAKMVEEVWGIGIRAKDNGEGGNGMVVEREEIEKCLDILMGGGERGKKIGQNAAKWRGLALEAVKEGGSSHNNLKVFLEKRWW